MAKSHKDLRDKLLGLQEKVIQGNVQSIERQHQEGKLTARERIGRLLDPDTFVEEFMLAETQCKEFGKKQKKEPSDGVMVGYGTVGGRSVYVFAQDRTVMAGTVGATHAEKISYAMETARKLGVPLIGLYDSPGARIEEGLDVTQAIGRMFYQTSITSGVVPQISAIMGPCIGVAAYCPALSDMVFMVKGTSQMFITGPPVIKAVTGEEVTVEQLGGWKVHADVSGVADVACDNDDDCLNQIRKLLSLLPANCSEQPPRAATSDPADRMMDDLESIVPEESKKLYDIKQVIRRVVDDGEFLEIKARYARNMVVGLGRLGGRSVGIVANQPMHLGGTLDVDCCDKACRFIRFCDAFNLPIITLVDVPGYLPGTQQEKKGIIRHGAKMLYAYSEATVPLLTVYLRKGYGGAKQAMCTREMGADQVLVWPGVELAVMGGDAAVDVLYRREIEQADDPTKARQEKVEEYRERFSGPFEALSKQYAHAAILPRETRLRLIQALEMFRTKKEERPRKKHANMPV
ncbi:MAG: methylmalonyl-CoA carboxyltransferase [Acidobacteria bacterium RIFCSPLOWO2_02_FULL_59_13]|nr:MAG: methylmalonyl-CoA carboxyltransferase [Acidobacteria bacterium RIFCSPLOWO2_02_FULL_59_13]